MKILINNEEHVTVSCNHLEGDPTKHHALTIGNYGGFLNCREFNRPEEKEESSATDNQQAKVAIVLLNRLSAWDNGGFPGVIDMPQKIVAEWRKATATVC